jgi:hypothetical protein
VSEWLRLSCEVDECTPLGMGGGMGGGMGMMGMPPMTPLSNGRGSHSFPHFRGGIYIKRWYRV